MALTKFSRRGITKAYFVPTIVNKAAPTVAEITAGTDLSGLVSAINGFTFDNQPINIPVLSDAFVGNIPGEDQVAASNIEFYEQRGSPAPTNPLRTTLAKGVTGFIVIFPEGIAGSTPAAADKAEVWPVQVTGPARLYDLGNVAAMWRAPFAMTAPPATDAVVAA